MTLYGNDLTNIGIMLIIIAAVCGTVLLILYFIMSSKLKKTLEREYGPQRSEEKRK